jgi:hypothetical protein
MRFRRHSEEDAPAVTTVDPVEASGWAGLSPSRVLLDALTPRPSRHRTRQETLFPWDRRYGHVRSR